jgi:hypothetical protein
MKPLWQIVVSLALCGAFAGPAAADWLVDTSVPPWCQRGELHWAIHYGAVTSSDVNLMVKARQNFVQLGGNYVSKEAADQAHAGGLHDLIYVCSRTFDATDYDQHPELKQAVVRKFDGSEVLAYNNPVRRFGCVNCPEWRTFVLAQVDQVQAASHPAGIFFDNQAWFVQCYCPVCRKKFLQYSRQNYGTEMQLPEHVDTGTQVGRAATLFLRDSQTAFHKSLLENCHARKERLLAVPNTCRPEPWPLHSIEEGVTDLPFYEESDYPPFFDSLYAYKLYLAAGRGRNVGRLMYLPEAIAAQRAKRVWAEAQQTFEYHASPLAKEFALAIAEGAAADCTFIPNYCLVPSLPITDTADPFNQGIYEVMNRYYDFLVRNRQLYLNAAQGGEVAILHSVPTDLWTNRGRQWQKLGQKLNRAGIPYEVIVERDLRAKQLSAYRVVLVDGVRAISDDGAAELAAYVKAGGKVIFGGQCGQTDERGEPHPSPILAELRSGAKAYQDRVRTFPDNLSDFDGPRLRQIVRELLGEPAIALAQPNGKVSVNVLAQPVQKLRAVHLLNYDYTYDKPTDASHLGWERACHIHPVKGLKVLVAATKAPPALLLSPGAAPKHVTATAVPGGFEYEVDVEVYAILVLAEDSQALKPYGF